MLATDEIFRVQHVDQDFDLSDLQNSAWVGARVVHIDRYWSGERATVGRQFNVRMLWSDEAIYVRFEAAQSEPLIVSAQPVLSQKTIGLWDRDVCEIFIAPTCETPEKYFEFEIAPTGEWVDLAIEFQSAKRISDLDYSSGVVTAARIGRDRVISAIKVPWRAFGKKPIAGDKWRGNLFRCVGQDPTRGYLAWQPTLTEIPNFHVPERFGTFQFVD